MSAAPVPEGQHRSLVQRVADRFFFRDHDGDRIKLFDAIDALETELKACSRPMPLDALERIGDHDPNP